MEGKSAETSLAFRRCTLLSHWPQAPTWGQSVALKSAKTGQDHAAGSCSPKRMDGQTDRQVRQAGNVVRAKVTTEPAGWAAQQKQETGWRHHRWIGSTKLWMTGEMAGMTDASVALLSPALPPVPAWPAGTQAHNPSPPSHRPAPHRSQMPGHIFACTPHPPLRCRLGAGSASRTSPPTAPWGCCPTRDIDGDDVGLDGAGLVPLLLLHGGQGEGPGPGQLLVRAGGEAQGGVGQPSTKGSRAGDLLFGCSPARGLWGERHVTH